MFGIEPQEFIILVALAAFLIGPDRLPEYAAKLRGWIRQARDMAEGAKTQLKDEMGPEFEDVNWRQYDPRQYDPRKIVRQALFDEEGDETPQLEAGEQNLDPVMDAAPDWEPMRYDPDRATPYDLEAT